MANAPCPPNSSEYNNLAEKDIKTDKVSNSISLGVISKTYISTHSILKEHNCFGTRNENNDCKTNGKEQMLKENKILTNIIVESSCKDNKNGLTLRLEPMGSTVTRFTKLTEDSSEVNMDQNTEVYYSVYIPLEIPVTEENINVFTDKQEALKVMKQSKRARFKQFKSKEDAIMFALNGDDNQANTSLVSTPTSPVLPTVPVAGEKPMPFKGPKTQFMIKFRKAIECGDTDFVCNEIWSNPRYLVSSGDTPSILQEGPRYNALHVAAKSKSYVMCQLILDAISSVKFIQYLYDEDDLAGCQVRANVLLDLYLNMPDKGLNETPLHFAVKYGAGDVVELLTSYPQCQKKVLNKFGQAPKDIVCGRVNTECAAVKARIAALLEDSYYVPVLRYEDNTIQPRIGEFFSTNDPLRIQEEPLSPRLEIQAYAGPMRRKDAEMFRRSWKTTQRSPSVGKRTNQSLILTDTEKGLEKVGRCLASEFKVPWKEYWPFLDTFIDLSSKEGLLKLEEYLKFRFEVTASDFSLVEYKGRDDSCVKDGPVTSPMTELCESFKSINLNSCDSPVSNKYYPEDFGHKTKKNVVKMNNNNIIDKYDKMKNEVTHIGPNNQLKSSQMPFGSALLYVEKSTQVYGKRIADAIYYVCGQVDAADIYKINVESLKDCLEQEIKHLSSLVSSYMDDVRFSTVDFYRIHSRVARITCEKLCQLVSDEEKHMIVSCLRDIEMHEGTYSDDEDLSLGFNRNHKKATGVDMKVHLNCIVTQLIENFSTCTTSLSTSAQSEADCLPYWILQGSQCKCCFDTNNTHHRKHHRSGCNDIKTMSRRLDFGSVASGEGRLRKLQADESSYESSSDDDNGTVVFYTPPSSPTHSSYSDSDYEQDSIDIPDTFICPGNSPSRTDLAVAEVIQFCHVTHEEFPNIYRWKHLLNLHSTLTPPAKYLTNKRTELNFTPTKHSPSTNSPSHTSPYRVEAMEPWERVLGPFSPRRTSNRTPSRISSPV